MNDTIFWAIIGKMGWSDDHDDKRISKEVKSQIYGDKERMTKFLEIYNEKEKTLFDIAHKMTDSEYKKYINESDDGLWDVVSNVIGLGQKHYNSIIKKHSNFKGIKRIENFSYSFQIIEKMK